nr:MAG TPA: hypothetical protein [Caudoviricetes sp.]
MAAPYLLFTCLILHYAKYKYNRQTIQRCNVHFMHICTLQRSKCMIICR